VPPVRAYREADRSFSVVHAIRGYRSGGGSRVWSSGGFSARACTRDATAPIDGSGGSLATCPATSGEPFAKRSVVPSYVGRIDAGGGAADGEEHDGVAGAAAAA
jgi:hypothetical protein